MKKVHTIAEIGVNFDSFETANQMIDASAEAKADFIKFQLFNEDTIEDSPIKDRLMPLILNEEKVKHLQEHARDHELGFILTPMYLDAIDIAAKYGDYIKIRYADHENEELIEKAEATGKTLLISVPYRPLNVYSPRKRYLYCLSAYPPRIEDFNLEVACSCHGFSSHFPHTVCDLAYVINRSFEECFIEKHVMLGTRFWFVDPKATFKPLPHEGGVASEFKSIDRAVSVTFYELTEFVSQIRLVEQMKRIRL